MNNRKKVLLSKLDDGDYFQHTEGFVYRKIPSVPSLFGKYNSKNLHDGSLVAISENEYVVFLKRSPLNKNEKLTWPSIDESELEYQIEFFRDYLTILDSYIHSDRKEYQYYLDSLHHEHKEDVEKILFKNNPIKIDPIEVEKNEIKTYIMRLDEYSDLLYSSFLISITSYLEKRLKLECEIKYERNSKLKENIEEIRQKMGVKNNFKDFFKAANSHFPFDSKTWRDITDIIKLRNIIVHNDGIITYDDHLKNYVSKLDCLSKAHYFGDDHVVISVEYCEKIISIIETLLHLLIRYREIDLVLSG